MNKIPKSNDSNFHTKNFLSRIFHFGANNKASIAFASEPLEHSFTTLANFAGVGISR